MNKSKIKVIKKNAPPIYNTPAAKEKNLKQRAEREISLNISGWVSEFQHRRREESKQAYNQLFISRN